MKIANLWLAKIQGARAYGAVAQVYFSTSSDDITEATKKAKRLASEVAKQNGQSKKSAEVASVEFVDELW